MTLNIFLQLFSLFIVTVSCRQPIFRSFNEDNSKNCGSLSIVTSVKEALAEALQDSCVEQSHTKGNSDFTCEWLHTSYSFILIGECAPIAIIALQPCFSELEEIDQRCLLDVFKKVGAISTKSLLNSKKISSFRLNVRVMKNVCVVEHQSWWPVWTGWRPSYVTWTVQWPGPPPVQWPGKASCSTPWPCVRPSRNRKIYLWKLRQLFFGVKSGFSQCVQKETQIARNDSIKYCRPAVCEQSWLLCEVCLLLCISRSIGDIMSGNGTNIQQNWKLGTACKKKRGSYQEDLTWSCILNFDISINLSINWHIYKTSIL